METTKINMLRMINMTWTQLVFPSGCWEESVHFRKCVVSILLHFNDGSGMKAGWNLLSLFWLLRAELILFSYVGLTSRLCVHMSGTAPFWPQILAQLQTGGWHGDPSVCRWQSLGKLIPGPPAAGRWVWHGIWDGSLIEIFAIGVPQIIKTLREAKNQKSLNDENMHEWTYVL